MAEKNAFKASIKKLAKWNGLNFDEAFTNVTECYKSDELPQSVRNVFEKVNENQTSTFWLCAAAMSRFYGIEGRLPVSGVLPDMVSTTEFYLHLQEIYIDKAKSDVAKMKELVHEVLQVRGLKTELDMQKFALFCKNASLIHIEQSRAIHEELLAPNWSDVADELMDPESSA